MAILSEINKGKTDEEVAVALRCSVSSINKIRRAMGIKYTSGATKRTVHNQYTVEPMEDIRMCLSCERKKCDGNIKMCKTLNSVGGTNL